MSDHTIVIILVVKIFFVQFFCVFLPPLLNISASVRSTSFLSFIEPIFAWKLKKVEKNTRPFRYDLNRIPYDYTVEVRNRCKGLDLIECLKNYGQRFVTLYWKQGLRPPQEKVMQKDKMVVWGGLKNSCENKRSRRQRKKKENIPIWMQNSKE